MARRRLSDTTHADKDLTDEYWLRFGDNPQPLMRDKIIYLTFEEVAKVGAGLFNVASVCDRLGVTHPMVNHYFGGRDALLAETAFWVYERHITGMWNAVQQAPRDPQARLRAWFRKHIESTTEIGGWGGILNYPVGALNISQIIGEKFGDSMQEMFEGNLMRLAVLVLDVINDEVTLGVEPDQELRAKLLENPVATAKAASVAWSALGVSVWNGGRHLPSASIPEVQNQRERLIEHHIDSVISSI